MRSNGTIQCQWIIDLNTGSFKLCSMSEANFIHCSVIFHSVASVRSSADKAHYTVNCQSSLNM